MSVSGLTRKITEFLLKVLEKIHQPVYFPNVTFYTLVSQDQAALAVQSGLEAAFQDRFFCRATPWPPQAAGARVAELVVQVPGSNWEHYRCYPTDLPQAAYYRIPLPALAQATVSVRASV